ncbi:MAG: hypothetical protein ACREJ3_13560, partial [Polyangiaceae bacterium]
SGDGDFKRFARPGSVALRSAVVDPGDHVLIDSNRENNHGSVRDAWRHAPRTLERATYFIELALSVVSP